MVGGALFTLGGVIPLTWFVISRRRGLKKVNPKVGAAIQHQEEPVGSY
jgi:hypothetical protein